MVKVKDINEEFESLLTEGVHDKAIFKAVFVNGGPGSGKDYVLNNVLKHHGLVEINSDKIQNHINKNSENGKSVKDLKHSLALKGRNGFLINDSGDDHRKTRDIKKSLENYGYDTAMVHVHADDEVSKKRNIERSKKGGRVIPENIRKQKWDDVQSSRQHHAKMFGNNYHEFDNSVDLRVSSPEIVKQKREELLDLHDKISEFIGNSPENKKAQDWISKELENSNKFSIPTKGARKLPHPNSKAAQQANELGLSYYGEGRYGKGRKITHYSINDNLTEIPEKKDKTLKESVSLTITGDTPEEVGMLFSKLRSNFTKENSDIYSSKSDSLTLGKNVPILGKSTEESTITNKDLLDIQKEDDNVSMVKKSFQEEGSRREERILLSETFETKISVCEEKSTRTERKTLKNFRESIDKNIEPGLSMASSGENLCRDTTGKKKSISELTGDETTSSIGDQKEDELKKKGILLSTFRSKKVI